MSSSITDGGHVTALQSSMLVKSLYNILLLSLAVRRSLQLRLLCYPCCDVICDVILFWAHKELMIPSGYLIERHISAGCVSEQALHSLQEKPSHYLDRPDNCYSNFPYEQVLMCSHVLLDTESARWLVKYPTG